MLILLIPCASWADEHLDKLKVGRQPDGSVVVPTNQLLTPTGIQVEFPGRPVDLILEENGKTIIAKNMRDLTVIDMASGQVRQVLPAAGAGRRGGGFSAVGLASIGNKVFVSDTASGIRVAKWTADGKLAWDEQVIEIKAAEAGESRRSGGAVYPTGIASTAEGKLWVCSNRANEVHLFNPSTGKPEATVAVGVAPYMPLVVGSKVYVSNWGGDRPNGHTPFTTSGSPVNVDPVTTVAISGSVSVLEKFAGTWKVKKSITVGLHPCGMALSSDGNFAYVANANSDTVSVIDTNSDSVVETIDTKPESRLPFGSGSNAVAVSPDGSTLFVANGTNNCVVVIALGNFSGGPLGPIAKRPSFITGMIPTGWYPGAITLAEGGKKLVVANVKGVGSLASRREPEKGKNSHDHMGSVSLIPLPKPTDLKDLTAKVATNNRLAKSLSGLEKPRAGIAPRPLPERHGEPSLIEHVIYVIKENRTYDQVFGDMKQGNGDPKLCIFGEEITPNHHKLARDFVLLDNYYCSGVLSADGHQWVAEAYVTDYLEKQFGGFTRSYPYEGDDPLAYAASGFLWDNALARKKAIFNMGEYCQSKFVPGLTWRDSYEDTLKGTGKVKVTVKPTVKALEPFTHPGYPGFPCTAPDIYRAKLFREQMATWEKAGAMPNLVYVFLPCDHTEGTRPGSPTPRAMVADNDLALGQVVEAVSNSRFWPKACIVCTEDDPQAGFDHVDGHRTVGFCISPYTRGKGVDSNCYNQTGMVKTIELLLGLPPMNQIDLAATPMVGCFHDKPDFRPYTAVQNRIPLDEMNPEMNRLRGSALKWAQKSVTLDFSKEDQADEDTLNRILWFAQRGDSLYPGDR